MGSAQIDTVLAWFEKAADTAERQGRHDSAMLWRDGASHLLTMATALQIIADWPAPQQDDMQAANMRRVAEDALDSIGAAK